ncbi:MAG TPA: hypothetical protein VEW07_05160 [Solirubrobacterales bacterium]|nr:hypothetical protein [Solirubrobacterales bacterium]
MLRLYRDNPELPVELPDEAILYAMRSEEIGRTLALHFDEATVGLGLKLIGRLGRAHDPRYRRVYLELADSVLEAVIRHRPREFRQVALRLIRRTLSLEADIVVPGEAYLLARIVHHHGLLLSQLGSYESAMARYEDADARAMDLGEFASGDEIGAEWALVRIHHSAAMHLSGESDRARELAREVDELTARTQAATYARIKLAEHCIVRDDIAGAADLLRSMVEGNVAGYEQPSLVNRTIALKDWAIVQAHGGDRTAAVKSAVAGLAMAKELGFRDQEEKMITRLGEVGISPAELRIDRAEPG